MFLLNVIYAGVTIGVLIALGLYIYYRNPEANWGSSTQGQVFVNAVKAAVSVTGKFSLKKFIFDFVSAFQIFKETPEHVKNYRPKILVMSGNPAHRPPWSTLPVFSQRAHPF
jgi:solute carrier family 12 sodium/potassium/chloride transporter 2